MIWHSSTCEEVLNRFNLDREKGLANGEADEKLEKYGKNILSNYKTPNFISCFFEQLKSKTVTVLSVIAVVAFIVSLLYEKADFYAPLLMIAIVVVDALVSAWFSFKTKLTLESLKQATIPTATVLRDGIEQSVPADTLVPGDIIILSEGDYISADARIIEENEFRCNESAITGEDVPVEKSANEVLDNITPLAQRVNMVFSGCSVVHGTAKAVVIATGLHTEAGHTTDITNQTEGIKMPSEEKLNLVYKYTNIFIIFICAVVFIINIIMNFSSGTFAAMTIDAAVNAVALAVATIPESIPAMASIVIAVGIERILQNNIIIKNIKSIETIGNISVICTDKTGVLTRNKMTVEYIYDGENMIDLTKSEVSEKTASILKMAACCSTLDNDSTEAAIENACMEYASFTREQIEELYPRLAVIPFTHERKTMTIINMIDEKPFAIVKGAPEIVIPKCMDVNVDELLKINADLTDSALRVICIAAKSLSTIPANPSAEEIENNLTFIGLIGIEDPPRSKTISSVAECEKAGIKTVMITGDNINTATAVARRIGILKDNTLTVTGAELDEMTDEILAQKVKNISVFARITPEHKQRIVNALISNGEKVLITGDSVDDAGALSLATIGCALGNNGTDVALGNADIIINKDNFSFITDAIRESRGLFANIKKTVFYLLSSNLAEIMTVFLGMIFIGKMPITALQLLWINLLTDSTPALALSMESAEPSVMKGNPENSLKLFANSKDIIALLVQSLGIMVATFISFIIGNTAGYSVAVTMAFLTLGLAQIFNAMNYKYTDSILRFKPFKNSFMTYSNIVIIFIFLFLCLTPAGFVFGLTILSAKNLFISILLAMLILPLGEIVKTFNKNN